MKLIEPDEEEDFEALLALHNLNRDDFELSEIDTTDPKTDEIFALMGTLTVARKSTGKEKQYPIGDGSVWVTEFERDIVEGFFN
jgi:hypothetical protein